MRADRLLAMLMLLQTRGRLTAQELADELEVSVRTVYRDLTALSTAGAPVYTERGPGGGCSLVDSYSTTLTGLTIDEARALLMLSIPAPLAQLGVSQELKTALLKLRAALPAARLEDDERLRQRFHLDASWWFQPGEALPHLTVLRQAVLDDCRLRLRYRAFFGTEFEQEVAPYGLVAKANIWYLVYDYQDRLRVIQVADILAVQPMPGHFRRPAEFSLAVFWQAWCAGYEEDRLRYPVTVRVSPQLVKDLPRLLGEGVRLVQVGPPNADSWPVIDLVFSSLEAARTRLLGLGSAVEVLEPQALRKTVIDFAWQVVKTYEPGGVKAAPPGG